MMWLVNSKVIGRKFYEDTLKRQLRLAFLRDDFYKYLENVPLQIVQTKHLHITQCKLPIT